jgi:hypothetical protein
MIHPALLSAFAPLLLAKGAAPAAPVPGLPLAYPAELQARLTEARRFTGFIDNCGLKKVLLATRRRYVDLGERLDKAIGRDRGIWGLQVKGHDLDSRGVEMFWTDKTDKAFAACSVATLNQSAAQAAKAISAYEAASAAATAPMAQGLWIGPVRVCKADIIARQSGVMRQAPGTLTVAFDQRGTKALRQVSVNSLRLPIAVRLDGRVVAEPILGDPIDSGRILVPFTGAAQLNRAAAALAEAC